MNSSLQSHFLNLYSMALADTVFDEKEIATIYRIASEKGIPQSEIDAIILNPAKVTFEIPESLNEKIECLYDYARLILADGIIEDIEIKTLEKFCSKFNFQEENVPTIVQLLLEAAKNNVSTPELINYVTQNA
jgi:uncharacterized tellurite resistance protein B-like protein